MPSPSRVYGWLLRLQPARFREEYGDLLERQFREEYRELHGHCERIWFWMRALADLAVSIPEQVVHEVRHDIRYGVRIYRARWLVTILALAPLALAIGSVTGVFSVLNALLLRSLPFHDAERLVAFEDPPVDAHDGRAAFKYWRNHSQYLQNAAAYVTWEMNLNQASESARVRVSEISASFFPTLGVEPTIGRTFSADEDTPGRDDVAVIGYGLWQQLFGGDVRAIGSTIRLNGAPVTVVGIAPPGFEYPAKTAVWTPTIFDWKRLTKTVWLSVGTVGRLKPGIRIAQARGMLESETERLNPATRAADRRQRRGLLPLREELAGPVGKASWVLLGVVGFVLLIACANVAHLLLSRVAERGPELAVRAALGASRARLVQQLTTESIALTSAAAAAGMAVAYWTSRVASLARPTQLSALAQAAKLSPTYTIFDWRVLGFVVAVAVVTGLLFGVLPAMLMGRVLQAQGTIRLQPGASSSGAGRMRRVLVAMQAALTVVLLAGSWTLGRSFLRLLGADLGFSTDRVVTLNVSLWGTRHVSEVARRQYYGEALARLRALSDVQFAAAVQNLPLMPGTPGVSTRFQLDPDHRVGGMLVAASPDYFRTMGTPIVEGREFTAADSQRAELVAIVNEAFAQQLGFKSGIVGRKIQSYMGRKEYTIVGVARTARTVGPSRPGGPDVFVHMDQQPPPFVTFVARTRGRPEPYLSLCLRAVQDVDPQVPVYDVKTLGQRLDDLLAGAQFYATAVLFLAVLAILLAILGVYGVAARSIAQHTHEIGVRIAVGAAPSEVRWMLLERTLVPVAVGTIAGIAGARGLGRFLGHLIENTEPAGVSICAAAALALIVTSVAVLWTATRRITQMDPMSVLRAE